MTAPGPDSYEQICFVVMPFGTKDVAGISIDFDRIYDDVFEPAVAAVTLPEGGRLVPRRADRDFFAGLIDVEMFGYVEYSRLVLADITGLNANVFYELGHRHRARDSGTVIFRQEDVAIPFDVSHVKAFPFPVGSATLDADARLLIQRVLTESLDKNRLDSPIAAALRAQRSNQDGGTRQLDRLLTDVENAIRAQDLPAAVQGYRRAIALDPTNFTLHLEVGVLLKQLGDWEEAVAVLREATRLEPLASEPHRELGIALNKLLAATRGESGSTGEDELRRAVDLDSKDFDAWASLGGVLKRRGDLAGALAAYERAAVESNGATYPLLNAVKLKANMRGALELSEGDLLRLRRARRQRQLQVEQAPPYDAPWSFFDLAEIELFLGNEDAFTRQIEDGILHCAKGWQALTCAESLELLPSSGSHADALARGISTLRTAADALATL